MSEWVSEWVRDRASICEWVNKWVTKWVSEWCSVFGRGKKIDRKQAAKTDIGRSRNRQEWWCVRVRERQTYRLYRKKNRNRQTNKQMSTQTWRKSRERKWCRLNYIGKQSDRCRETWKDREADWLFGAVRNSVDLSFIQQHGNMTCIPEKEVKR